MSERGVFTVDRGIWDHPIFAPEPFTEREAWVWLVGEAAWKPTRIRTPRGMISVDRGQVVHSQRFLASKWRWDRAHVRRFLALLQSEKMVAHQRPVNAATEGPPTAHQTTHLTICNYDKYQFGRPTNGPPNEQETAHRTAQKRPKEEEERNKKEEVSKKETREVALSDDWPPDFENLFWMNFPNKVGKPAAMKALSAARRRKASFAEILSGLDLYIRSKPPDRSWLNPATFLNQNRWEDKPAQVQNGNLVQAADRILEKFNQFDGPRILDSPGENVVRMLPNRPANS